MNSICKACSICRRADTWPLDVKSETRPYGVGGALVCVRCFESSPVVRARAELEFGRRLDDIGDNPAILTRDGPRRGRVS